MKTENNLKHKIENNFSMKPKNLKFLLLTLGVILSLFLAARATNLFQSQQQSIDPPPKSVITEGSMVEPCSYMIFIGEGSPKTYFAKNCSTGEISFADTNASNVFQQSINSLTNGGTIFVKSGIYEIKHTIFIQGKNDISLVGESRNSTILLINGALGKIDGVTISESSNIRIKNLWIDAKTYDQRAAIAASNVNNTWIIDSRLENLDEIFGVYFAGPTSPNVNNDVLDVGNKLINCEIWSNYTGDGLSWSYQKDSEIVGCKIYGRVALYLGKNLDFHDNNIYGSPNQILWITGDYYNLNIHNNIFRDVADIFKTSGNLYGLKIHNNIFYRAGPSNSAVISISGNCYDTEISNNYITESRGGAISISCNGRIIVKDNIITNANTFAKNWYNGGSIISVNTNYNLTAEIIENKVYYYNATSSEPSPFSLGANSVMPVAEIILKGNIFNCTKQFRGSNHPSLGNKAYSELYQLLADYTGSFKMTDDNYCFTTNYTYPLKTGYFNSNNVTLPASQSSVTIAHNLVSTPTKIIVTPEGNVGNWWVSAKNSTHFTVSVSTAPTSNVVLNWYAEV
jgi:hypothetical protein